MNEPWSPEPGGLRLLVRLTPRAQSDAIEGVAQLADGRAALRARVRAIPEDGKANAALTRLIAQTLDVPSSRIQIAAGHKGRLKTVTVEGASEALIGALARVLQNKSA